MKAKIEEGHIFIPKFQPQIRLQSFWPRD